MKRIAYLLAMILATTVATGCKLRILSPENGEVVSLSGSRDCQTDEICEIDVVDLFFNDTFTAVPATGFIFNGWKKADGHFCGGSNKPCVLTTRIFDGFPVLESFLATDSVFSLSPEFFEPYAELPGEWQGRWVNETFNTEGNINLSISPGVNNGLRIEFDVDGNAFGDSDPPPTSITLRLDGRTLNISSIEFNDYTLIFRTILNQDGTLELEIPSLPDPTLDTVEVNGRVTPNLIKLDYKVNFTLRTAAVGTVVIEKIED